MLENPRTEPFKYTILIVDDEELIRNLVVTFLSKLGHWCITANNGVDALNKMRGDKFDAVITDIKMPEMDGIMLTREISKRYPEVPVMVMTAYDEEYSAGTAISLGAREFIKKPFSLSEFVIRLQKMISDAESLKPKKSEKNEHEDMEEFFNELEIQKGMKNEKGVDEDMQDLMNELDEALKKR